MDLSTTGSSNGVGIMLIDEAKRRQSNLEELAKYESYHIALSDRGRIIFLDDEGNEPPEEIRQAIAKEFIRLYPQNWHIYLAKYDSSQSIYKIGISTDPEKRAYQLSLRLLHTIECRNKSAAIWSEMRVHANFICLKKHIHLEWFELDSNDVE